MSRRFESSDEGADRHFVNATFLPLPLQPQYDALWTAARMKRVIDAAVENDVAIEINDRYRIPSPAFIKVAKAAGAKFSFGTNNAEAELGRIEYPIQMVRESAEVAGHFCS